MMVDLENPTVATYAQDEGVLVRITAAAPTRAEAQMMARIIGAQCRDRIGVDAIKKITEE